MAVTKDTYVTEQLTARGMANTAANRKKLSAEYDKRYLGGSSEDWRTYFRQQFPQLAGMIDGAEGEQQARSVFGNQLIDLFLEVAKNPDGFDFTSEAGQAAFTGRVQATDYYNKTKQARIEWDVLKPVDQQARLGERRRTLAAALGDLELTETEVADLALYAEQNKASDLEIKYLAYNKVGERGAGAVATTTTEGDKLRRTLKAYGYSPADINDRIQAALGGQVMDGVTQTSDLLIKKAKQYAKAKYNHLSDLLDQDFTVEDIFEPYKEIATKVLELNPQEVTLDNELFAAALDAGPDGRPMSGLAWAQRIKQDPRYNWRFTKNANDQVRNTIMSLEKAFGMVR
jgi:hypothetical protein